MSIGFNWSEGRREPILHWMVLWIFFSIYHQSISNFNSHKLAPSSKTAAQVNLPKPVVRGRVGLTSVGQKVVCSLSGPSGHSVFTYVSYGGLPLAKVMGICYDTWTLETLIMISQSVKAGERATRAAISVEYSVGSDRRRGKRARYRVWHFGNLRLATNTCKEICEVASDKSRYVRAPGQGRFSTQFLSPKIIA